MATGGEYTQELKGSDQLVDFSCTFCSENEGIITEAQFYCKQCSKCFCTECVTHHNQLFKKHVVIGRGEKDVWPATESHVGLEKCDQHPDKNIELFCEDHRRLCCLLCQFTIHSLNIEDQDVEVTTIPPPVPKPGPAGLDTTGKEFVFFDLETTGFERTSHIIEIAAVHTTGQFSTYVMPEEKMSWKASEITGVTVVGESMLVKGQKVTAVPIKSALTSFISFLQKCSPVILVGHNIDSFDCKVLLHAIHNCGKMFEFQQNVCGFLDTYKMLKGVLPNMTSYKQEHLVKYVIGETYMAHGALQDVLALQKLVNHVALDQNIVNKYSFSYDRAVLAYNVSQNVASNIKSLQTMIDKKVISQDVARKIAGSGLQLKHLSTVSKRNGLSGLRSLLSEVTNGQIRVTKSEQIIRAVASYLLPDI